MLRYTEQALQRFPRNSPLVSCSLPLDDQPRDATAFLAGLLPEGHALQVLATRAGVATSNVFDLLERYGRDIAGALVFATGPRTPTGTAWMPTTPTRSSRPSRRSALTRSASTTTASSRWPACRTSSCSSAPATELGAPDRRPAVDAHPQARRPPAARAGRRGGRGPRSGPGARPHRERPRDHQDRACRLPDRRALRPPDRGRTAPARPPGGPLSGAGRPAPRPGRQRQVRVRRRPWLQGRGATARDLRGRPVRPAGPAARRGNVHRRHRQRRRPREEPRAAAPRCHVGRARTALRHRPDGPVAEAAQDAGDARRREGRHDADHHRGSRRGGARVAALTAPGARGGS